MNRSFEEYFDQYFKEKPVLNYDFNSKRMGRKDKKIIQTLRNYGLHGKRCLDVGPGTGRWIQFLKKNDAGYLGAVDIADIPLERCKLFCDKVQKVNIENESIDWPANFFDVMLCIEVFEHLVDHDHCVSEILRVLKHGGLLLLSTPNLVSCISRVRILLGMLPVSIASDITHVRHFRRQEIAALFSGQNVQLKFVSTAFSLNPLNPKSRFRCPSFGPLSTLDDSLLAKVIKR